MEIIKRDERMKPPPAQAINLTVESSSPYANKLVRSKEGPEPWENQFIDNAQLGARKTVG